MHLHGVVFVRQPRGRDGGTGPSSEVVQRVIWSALVQVQSWGSQPQLPTSSVADPGLLFFPDSVGSPPPP